MGRWTSQLYCGKQNLELRIVSVNFETTLKEQSRKKIYMQQKLTLLKMNRKESVYEAFWVEFWDRIDK